MFDSDAEAAVLRRFGIGLRLAREAAGMTQADLARASGISAEYIARTEAGKTAPLLLTAWDLADALDVSPAAFFVSEQVARTADD